MKETYVAALYEGTFAVGIDKKFNKLSKDAAPPKGTLKLSLNPFLIHTKDRNFLIDCGIGELREDSAQHLLKDNLLNYELTEHDITDILISHLHYDHFGGLAHREHGFWELTFPNAKVWVSKEGWQKLLKKQEGKNDEKAQLIYFLDARADLHFMEETDHPYAEITVQRTGGHSQFHQVIFFDNGELKLMMPGDVIGSRSHINRKFVAKYDYDPQTSLKKREELTQLAYERGYTILAYHDDSTPIFKITGYNEKSGYVTETVNPNVTS